MRMLYGRWRSTLVLLIPLLIVGIGVGLAVSHSQPHSGSSQNQSSHSHPTSRQKAADQKTVIEKPAGQQATYRPVIGMGRPGPGFVRNRVTAIGDSVMVDYQDVLKQYLPGVNVDASVGLQFQTGISLLAKLRSEDRLGATVIVALGTNGPITPTLMAQMLSTLKGASRIVFVTNHVDLPWQNPNNAIISATAAQNPHIVVANWAARSNSHPSWFYSDQTHLPIDGVGAHRLAWIIRQAVHRP